MRPGPANARQIIDSVPGLVFTTTAGGETDFVNRQMVEYFGRPAEQLMGWLAGDCIHPEDVERVSVHWRHAVLTGAPSEIELRLRRADGAWRWFHYKATPEHDMDGRITCWYVLATDIDERKQVEEALRTTQARLSKATHLASLSELAASIAHEINQPLAAVVAAGHACRRWLSADPPCVDKASSSAERVIRDANAAAEVIQRIRSLFRKAPPRKELLDMNAVIQEVCDLLADDLRARDIVLRTNLRPGLPRVPADRIQMQQVLSNLARNAIEAMDSVVDCAKLLVLSSHQEDGQIIVQVVDCGIGISDAQPLFESFSSTKARGLGIGLAISRSIVEAHGGQLTAARNALRGSTFSFSVPIEQAAD